MKVKHWKDLRVPARSTLKLLWRMCGNNGAGSGSIAEDTELQFNLCWTHPELAAPFEKHLNGVCIALTSSGQMHHIDFKSYYKLVLMIS